jgi:small subunit ribosomal protein S15
MKLWVRRHAKKGEAIVMPLPKELKDKIIADFHQHPTDTGSTEVQIALITTRIQQLTAHLQKNTHDESSRHGLIKLVGQRRRFLAYLRRKNYQRYLSVTQSLNLRSK